MRTLLLIFGTLLTVIGGAAWNGVHVHSFYQPSAMITVFGSIFIYMMLAVGPRKTASFCIRVFKNVLEAEDRIILERLSTLGFLFGGISVVMGVIHLLQNLADTASLGAGLAVAFIGLVYGAMPAIISTLLMGKLPSKSIESRNYMGASALVTLTFLAAVIFALSQNNGVG